MKAAIYCRLSEEDKNKTTENEDSNSIKNQKSMLIQYAKEQNWDIYNIYSDDDYTGADRNRPQFKMLIEDAQKHRFDIVLCKTQSRFTREMELVEKYIHGLFPIWGIRFVSIVDNADTANTGNKKSRQINGLINEWYLEDMSENIKSVLNNKRKSGCHIGSFALYGYKKDPNIKGHLIIDNEAAEIVKKVFTLFSQGYGKKAIADILNEQGVPNPTEYKRLKGIRYKQPKNYNSTLWKYPAISNMLSNEMYIGNMVQGKYGSISYKTKKNKPRPKDKWYIVKGTHDAIIDKELWDKVQNILKENSKPYIKGKTGLFSGKVFCKNCGSKMISSKSRGKSYYKCSKHYHSKENCIGAFISADKLESIILNELNKITDKYLDKNLLCENIIYSDLETIKKQFTTEILLNKKKLEEYSLYITELYKDKVKGLLSESDYTAMYEKFSLERKHIEQIIKSNNESICNIEKSIYEKRNINIIEKYTTHIRLSYELIETMIDHISIGKRIKGTTEVPVDIYWNF